jgi:hypothetical protein
MRIVVGTGTTGLSLDATWLSTMNTALGRNFTGGNPVPLMQHLPCTAESRTRISND